MNTIVNEPKNKFPLIRAVRELLEHRALWLYLLVDEARKKGIDPALFAPEAIRRCGRYQGKVFVDKNNSQSLNNLKKSLFTLPGRMVFEMKILRLTDDNFDVDFHYCPLVKAWQKQGCTAEDLDKLCEIAMCGDRGIAESFGCELDLVKTIARGDGVCQIRFRRSAP
ncbi:MAG: L-2-amino-thiazoline-4-carboxylic acid hydrolase [Spirochaetaceae bacterium]|jgi:hypothetical protein|nr:L-2-amino-thiazoline-4-carboxylic acid hydrolase [Spirochaetaceae bacterium]